jgi:hypothetical protein
MDLFVLVHRRKFHRFHQHPLLPFSQVSSLLWLVFLLVVSRVFSLFYLSLLQHWHPHVVINPLDELEFEEFDSVAKVPHISSLEKNNS